MPYKLYPSLVKNKEKANRLELFQPIVYEANCIKYYYFLT